MEKENKPGQIIIIGNPGTGKHRAKIREYLREIGYGESMLLDTGGPLEDPEKVEEKKITLEINTQPAPVINPKYRYHSKPNKKAKSSGGRRDSWKRYF